MAAAEEPLLDAGDIQGNILAGFNKDHQLLVALNIRDVEDARRWLARIAPHVSTMAEVAQFNALFRMQKKRLGHDPTGLVASWMNIAFSRGGIAKLISDEVASGFPDPSFVAGLEKDRAVFLGDPAPPGSDPTSNWVVGGTGRAPDVFVILASDDPAQLEQLSKAILPRAEDGPRAPEPVWSERGDTIESMPGHEHFGFKDGISQPGVRGLVSKRPKTFLTPRLLKPGPQDEVEFAKPGQPLVWPGNFVLGYPSTNRNDGTPVPPAPLPQPWLRNGSFLVFRRLNQNVAGFSAFLTAQAADLAKTDSFRGITPEHLGALVVGRWPSGAPVSRSPRGDDPALAADNLANNDFLLGQDTPPPSFAAGVKGRPFPPALEGTNGPVCPRAAHIVKVNPRELASNVGPDFDTLTRRILRRGTPFGPRLDNPMSGDDGKERGLHFLCYQASIEEQFEFLQQNWANSKGGPLAGGHDVIIGQTGDQKRTMELPAIHAGQQPGNITTPTQWVTPTGGGYFFAPSISAIKHVLAGVKPAPAPPRKRRS